MLFVLAAVAGAQADFWSSVKDVGSDVGEFFEKSFTDFKSLFANDQTVRRSRLQCNSARKMRE